MYAKIQEFSKICKEGKLVFLGRQNSFGVGRKARSYKMDRMFKVDQRKMWKVMSRKMGEYPQSSSKKRQLVF